MRPVWPASRLGELVHNFDALRVPLSRREREKRRGKYPYYGATGIIDYVDDFLFEGLHLLIAEDGSVERPDGMPFLQLIDGQFWVNNHAHVLKGQTDSETRYLYYALSAVPIRPYISGSVQAKLSQRNLNRISVVYPTSETDRRAITHVLRTLDEKIDLNRRMNETLEEMARALFKSWFVDFDPVRAKVEGRWRPRESLPGLPAHLYNLFSDRLVDSELGRIPEGWEVGTLGDVAEPLRRSVRPDQIEPDTPYLALKHMPKQCIALSDWSTASGLESNKFEFKQREILFGKLRPYFHKVGVAPVDGVCSTDIVVLAPKKIMWFGFLLGHVSSVEFVDYADSGSTGTRMPRTNWKDMTRYDLVLPPESVADAFTTHVRPLVDRINAGIHESRRLAALRDTLLPKLVFGELPGTKVDQILARAEA